MAGRKPIVSARQLKARVQIIMRATDKDVAQNSEKNRLIDMTESMREAGLLQEFLLDCLRSKLRQDEGQNVAVYRMFEGGQTAPPQGPTESQTHCQQQHAPAPAVVPSAEVEAGSGRAYESPSAIIESVVREIESSSTSNEAGFTAPPPAERRRPKSRLLEAMG